MPTIEPVDYAERLEEMARLLLRQGATPELCAMDGPDLKDAAAMLRRLAVENARLRGAVAEALAGIGRLTSPEGHGPTEEMP